MKYTREEYNNKLLLELEYSQQKGELIEDLKILYFDLVNDISKNKERYPFTNDDNRVFCVVLAYNACIEHGLKFNRHKSNDAFAYVSTIIRCSFAGTLLKLYKRKHHDNN